VPTAVLDTCAVTVQLPLAGITASERLRLPPVAVTATDAPVQVVLTAPEVAKVRDAGSVSVRLDWVRANAFELLKVMVSVEVMVSPTVVGTNAAVTVGVAGVTAIAAGQALLPAEVGALEVALVDPMVTVAVSVPPCESVTVTVNVPVPDATTFAELAPELMVTPVPAVQA
jgi:hypothetical protein